MIKRFAKLAVLLVAALSGCASPPPPKYYHVPTDPSVFSDGSVQSYRESLRVTRFRALVPLSQDSIVTYHDGSTAVDFSPNEYWESSPPDIVKRKLAEAFQASGLFSRVDSRPTRPSADYVIRGRILRFNRLATREGQYGEVGLEVEFIDQRNGAILWSATIRAREKAAGDDGEAASHAVGEALEQCVGQILQQVRRITAYYGSPA